MESLEANSRIEQMINEVHVPNTRKSDTIKVLEQEQEQLKRMASLPEEIREARIRGVLNYCKNKVKACLSMRFNTNKQLYVRGANNRITEILRRAKNEIEQIRSLISELNKCKDSKEFSIIQDKFASLQEKSYFQKGFRVVS